MLPKSRRLNLKKSFKWAVTGTRVETPSFKIYVKKGDNLFPKVGIALTRSQFKKAHERVEAKRLSFKASESIYQSLSNDLNLVIMPKAIILKKTALELIKELEDVKTRFNTD